MDRITAMAASGLRARMESLDLLANNIANASTAGFKADREFYNLYAAQESIEPDSNDSEVQPIIERRWTDLSQGNLTNTSNPLDLALSGPGFFVVDGTDGPRLTRSGNFRLSSTGVLESADGLKVLGDTGKAIALDPSRPVTVAADGTISQDDTKVAKLQLVDASEGDLSKLGHTYFRFSSPDTPKVASSAKVQQGSLESSNGEPAEQAVRLISVMRQFEMLQKAVSIGTDMNRKAIEDVARVGS